MLMPVIRKFFIAVIVATTLISPVFAANNYHVEDQPQVIEQVILLEQRGILKQKENGYIYIEVVDDFIELSVPLIEAPGEIVYPHEYTTKKGIGAHISVMYENELDEDIREIKELGQEFTFTIIDIRTVKLGKDNTAKKLWLIALSAPELEILRESYGLSSLLNGHDFHITIGTEVELAEAA